jgi:hypothetical protein
MKPMYSLRLYTRRDPPCQIMIVRHERIWNFTVWMDTNVVRDKASLGPQCIASGSTYF